MIDEAKALLLQLGYDIDSLEASTNRATGVVDAGTGKMVSRTTAACRQINAEFGKISADGVRSAMAEIAKLQDHLVDATTAGEKGIAAALRAEIDVRERVQKAAVAQLDTQLAIAKATGNSAQVKELQQVLALYQQIQKQRAVGVTGTVGLTGAQGVVDALGGGKGGHGGGGGLNRMQGMELAHSARATFDALAAGADPLRVLAMEGPRVVQALGSGEGGVGGVLKGLMSAVSPTVLALGALGAALAVGIISAVQYVNGVHEIMNAVAGLGRTSGVTEGQIESLAETQARSGKISEGAAQALAIAMITTGKVTRENLAGATDVAEEFAEVTKTKLGDATKILTKAFADPAKGARELVDTYGLLSGAEVEEIERLQERGDKTGALTKLVDSLKSSLDQASGGLKAHAEGWDAIANAAKGAWTEIGKAAALSLGFASTQAKLKDLEFRRSAIQDSPIAGAVRADLDKQIAALKAQQAKENAQVAANAKEAQLNQKSLSVADAAKALDKKDTEIDVIQQRQKDLRDALADPTLLKKSGLSEADARKAIAAGDKQIADIRKRGVPADQTLDFDKAAADAANQGLKDLITAQAALVTGIHDHAAAEKAAVDADLAKRLKDIDLEAEKIGKAKNDANAKSQLALLRKAKIDEEDAADAKREMIDRQAAAAALAEVIQTRNEVQAQHSRIAGNEAAMAPTRADRSAIERANLLAEQKLARDNFDATTEQERKGRSDEINPDLGIYDSDLDLYNRHRQSVRDAMVAGQQSDLQRQTYNSAGPLDEYARSVQDLDTTLQGDLVSGIKSFDQALISIPGHADEAGQILENWFMGLALRVAEHELEADIAPSLVNVGKSALAFLGLAGGGQVHGPGTSTSDSIPTMLSDEEFVVNAKQTRKHLALLHAINAGKPLAHFSGGGQVGGARTPNFPLLAAVAAIQMPTIPQGGSAPSSHYYDLRGAWVDKDVWAEVSRISAGHAQVAEDGAVQRMVGIQRDQVLNG